MKKFITVFLILILLIAPLSVSAAPINYLRGYSWNTSGLSCSVNVQGLDVTATGIAATYSSPLLDILPAVKRALSFQSKVTLKLSGTCSVIMAGDSDSTNVHLNLRAKINMQNADMFDKEYTDSLKGDEPFFNRSGGNVMRGFPERYTLGNSESVNFFTVFTVTRNQVYSSATPNWFFCVDGLNAANEGKILAIGIKDMSLTVVSENEITNATPAPPARKTPSLPVIKTPEPPAITPVMTAAPTAAPTKKPTATPKPKATENPKLQEKFVEQPLAKDLGSMAGSVLSSTFIIIIVTGAISLFVTLLASKNRKE